MVSHPKIMIVGLGSTGNYVLDLASKRETFRDCRFTVVSRTPVEEAQKRLNITRVSAGLFDLYPDIEYRAQDVTDIEGMAELIRACRPDFIAYTGRYMKGLKYGGFSYPNGIGYGVWLPLAVVLVEKLMRAVKKSGVHTKVINTSYGDGVSPALQTVGLAPMVSAGNLNHMIPRIKRAVCRLIGGQASPYDVRVRLVGSHYLNTYVSREGSVKGSAYDLYWTCKGEKIQGISDEQIFALCNVPTVSGPERNWMIASDVVRLLELMLAADGKEYSIHAPGPFGLLGGYPLLFQNGEMRLDESVLSKARMEAINKDNLRCDGIDAIDRDGLHFTGEARDKMKQVFGIDYPKILRVEDCESFAQELAAAVRAYGERR